MIYYRNSTDDVVSAQLAEAIGRLLIDIMQLEEMLRTTLEQVLAPIDPVGILAAQIKDLTTGRKIETAVKAINAVAVKFDVPSVPVSARRLLMTKTNDPVIAMELTAEYFASFRQALSLVQNTVSYRNNLFHGEVEIDGSKVTFVSKAGQLPSDPVDIQQKRQEALEAMAETAMSASGFRASLQWLIGNCQGDYSANP